MRSRALLLLAGVVAVTVAAGCRTEQTIVTPDPHLERMLDQPKAMPYAAEPLLPLGAAMQLPPEGTMTTSAQLGSALIATGESDGVFAERIPVPVDRALLEAGRAHFEVFCAACHGILGDGDTPVARHMALRKPPNLHLPPASTLALGEQFHVIRNGYGLMPSYAVQLGVRDAWAVVAYLAALRLARHAEVASLPADLRAELAKDGSP